MKTARVRARGANRIERRREADRQFRTSLQKRLTERDHAIALLRLLLEHDPNAHDLKRARDFLARVGVSVTMKHNPPRRGGPVRLHGKVIGPELVAIHYLRRKGSKTVYVHPFDEGGPKVPVVGLEDGSLLIPSKGTRLWGEV